MVSWRRDWTRHTASRLGAQSLGHRDLTHHGPLCSALARNEQERATAERGHEAVVQAPFVEAPCPSHHENLVRGVGIRHGRWHRGLLRLGRRPHDSRQGRLGMTVRRG